jgi:hypothetical protein
MALLAAESALRRVLRPPLALLLPFRPARLSGPLDAGIGCCRFGGFFSEEVQKKYIKVPNLYRRAL